MVVSETDAIVALCRSENVEPNIQCGDKVHILDLGSKLDYWKLKAKANMHSYFVQNNLQW